MANRYVMRPPAWSAWVSVQVVSGTQVTLRAVDIDLFGLRLRGVFRIRFMMVLVAIVR